MKFSLLTWRLYWTRVALKEARLRVLDLRNEQANADYAVAYYAAKLVRLERELLMDDILKRSEVK